jgi:hypothetical protein
VRGRAPHEEVLNKGEFVRTVQREGNPTPAVLRIRGKQDFVAEKILTTRVGLMFPEAMTFDSWERAGSQLFRLVDSTAWCLGDWLVYGQREYSDRYQRAVEAAGLDYQTLRNYAWVSRSFELSRRRARLSFQHHAEVASLPAAEQDHWLDRAEQGSWSRNKLRKSLRDSRDPSRAEQEAAVLPRVAVSSDHISRWREAAKQASSSFEQWVVHSLDRAAEGHSLP